MGRISISDGVSTWTGLADENESPIWNANSSVTIGGVTRSQADTQRLKIELRIVGYQSEIASLMSILKNFNRPIYYTPSRILFDKSAIDIIQIAITGSPSPDIKGRNGELVLEMKIDAEEVIAE